MNRRRAPMLAALAILAAPAAQARAAAPPAKAPAPAAKHDNNAPVDIEADRVEVLDREHKATWAGKVRVVQGEMTLTADRATALYTGSVANSQPAAGQSGGSGGAPKIQRLDAAGNVVVTRPGEIAKGNYAIDDLNAKLITMIGNVSLDRNGSIVRGGRLVINQNTNQAVMDGSAVNGGGATTGKGGRVSGRFIVDQSNDASNTSTPAK